MSNDDPPPGTSATSTVLHTSSSFKPFAIELPERLDFHHPESWKRWIVRWKLYRVIPGLQKQDDDTHISTFLYAMESEAEDVLVSLRLDDEEAKDYNKLKARFQKRFIPIRNVIFERARFNQRSQLEHEAVEKFVTVLHRLAESCDFGSLKDELIRDRLVVGLRDKNLSEKLQLDANLTLEKAANTARLSETVKELSTDSPTDHSSLNWAKRSATERLPVVWVSAATRKSTVSGTRKAVHPLPEAWTFRNGLSVAQGQRVRETAAQCPGPSRVPTPKTVLEEVFLGTISNTSPTTDPWFITARVQDTDVRLKVDTSGDVTAIPASALPPNVLSSVIRPTKVLYGPGRSKIDTLGQLKADITCNGRATRQDVFVIRNLRHALLGRPAIQSLNMLPQILAVEESSTSDPIARKYRKLFGPELSQTGTHSSAAQRAGRIKADGGSRSHPPSRPPYSLVHADVVGKKKDGKLRICVDYAELNKQVMRERLTTPTVEENLWHISCAKLFSKLDANAGYWRMPLSPASSEMTTFNTAFGRYRFPRLPFGISTAPEFFQREMLRNLECLEAAELHFKDDLTGTPVPAFYSPERPITLSVDASSYGLGAVLLQEETDGHRCPVAYASRALSETEQGYAQVEKEALAIAWACDKFRIYVLGLQFHVETDHKPLVPIFLTKRLDELTPRLQRLRLRALEYDFTIRHVPGKQLFTANVLSRNHLTSNWAEDFTLAHEIKEYETLALSLLPASSDMLTRIRRTLSLLMEYWSTQWPPVSILAEECRKYVTVADELALIDGLLLRGTRLVIPTALRHEVMTHLHTGHQGAQKARNRTLASSGLRERLWQVIGMDTFHENRQNYVVVVDYFSKFFEVAHLRTTISSDLIAELRPMFARHARSGTLRRY
ncbi:uncharacterized protein LOC135384188 [Ornithodoros turicata]|uniref:uncharacterized protein LOC135384188 n=1 Tax=Ornithodoros turicata TaxID=34597 RepID=UPI00313971A3